MNVSTKRSITFVLVVAMVAMCFIPMTQNVYAADSTVKGEVSSPADGATNVDPELVTEATISFDDDISTSALGEVKISGTNTPLSTSKAVTAQEVTYALPLLAYDADYTITATGFIDDTASGDAINVSSSSFKTGKDYQIETTPTKVAFDTVLAGYDQPDAEDISVNNTALKDTGILDVELVDESSEGAFTLDKTTLSSINRGGVAIAKVQPVAGAPADEYSATVKISNATVDAVTVPVSFEVQAKKQEITVTPNAVTFDTITYGETQPAAEEIEIENSGNVSTGALEITLGGIEGSSPEAFTINKDDLDSIEVGSPAGIVEVGLKAGLKAGEYSAQLIVSGASVETKTADLTFVVDEPEYKISVDPENVSINAAYGINPSEYTKTVTVKNAGNISTGALNVTKGGSSPSAFVLDGFDEGTTINSIAKTKSADFTVEPAANLTNGAYEATVTISGVDIATPTVMTLNLVVSDAAYSIDLSEKTIDFDNTVKGVTNKDVTPKAIDIINTGNISTGALDIALTDGDTTAFALSTPTVGSILEADDDSFTVVPEDDLDAGTYTATVSVGNAKVTPAATATVTYTVDEAEAKIAATPTAVEFDSVDVGYTTAPSAKAVTVDSTGNITAEGVSATLESTDSAFELTTAASMGDIAAGADATFDVQPKTSLPAATYTDTINITGDNVSDASVTVKFVVKEEVIPPADKYTVSFNANGGKAVSTKLSLETGDKYGKLPSTSRTGYKFKGWFTTATGKTRVTETSTFSGTKDQTLYAQWTVQSYKIKFVGNKGKVSKKTYVVKSKTYGKKMGTLPKAKRTGYNFKGWYTKKSGGKKVTKNTVMKYTKTTKVYAQWTPNAKIVKASAVWMHKKPYNDSKRVKAVKKGTKVSIVGKKGKGKGLWYKVKAGSKTGYIYHKYVKRV